jgi:transposase
MTNPQERRRQQAVARYLAGDPIETICHEMRCSKSWLYKWKNRYPELFTNLKNQPGKVLWAPG